VINGESSTSDALVVWILTLLYDNKITSRDNQMNGDEYAVGPSLKEMLDPRDL